MKVAGLVAAAGDSSRMGRCKALLPFSDDVCFAQRLAEIFVAAALDPVVVTLPDGPDAALVERRLEHLPLMTSRNERPAEGLSGSVVTAMMNIPDAEALVVAPVDCPFADVALVQTLVAALKRGRGVAAVPVVSIGPDDYRGHPVAFARPAFDLLWTASSIGGPRAVLDALGKDVVLVPWGDPRVTDDVDTPDDYERLFGGRPRS